VKVYLDTNVLASAFGTRGLCADVLALVLTEHELISGEQVLDELERVLRRKFRVPPKRVTDVVGFVRSQAQLVEATARPLIKLRDPADARILGEAIAGGAEVLVTGDGDLLAVASKAPLAILTPRGFWERLRG
jgi:putative PIN family toxin of toxin-antitoxin system